MDFILSDEDYEFIKGEVVNVITSYEVRCIPISGFEIAKKMGIRLREYSSLSRKKKREALKISQDGFYMEENGVERIYYNDENRSYKRINMTILHEIGHCVLDHTGINKDKEEKEAKFFAKYAIAPPPLIERIKPKSYEDIYDNFDISDEASFYAWEYYLKWKKNKDQNGYTDYECDLLKYYDDAA